MLHLDKAEIADLLPQTSVWEMAGGNSEFATVMFLRGSILSSYGFIETQLNEIMLRLSKLEEFNKLADGSPWKVRSRMKFLRQCFAQEGPLLQHRDLALDVINAFENEQDERNRWAHGKIVVLPGSTDNRWHGAWITLQCLESRGDHVQFDRPRFQSSEIVEKAKKLKRLSELSNALHCAVDDLIPRIEI